MVKPTNMNFLFHIMKHYCSRSPFNFIYFLYELFRICLRYAHISFSFLSNDNNFIKRRCIHTKTLYRHILWIPTKILLAKFLSFRILSSANIWFGSVFFCVIILCCWHFIVVLNVSTLVNVYLEYPKNRCSISLFPNTLSVYRTCTIYDIVNRFCTFLFQLIKLLVNTDLFFVAFNNDC